MRENKDTWRCVLCKDFCFRSVICPACADAEMDKQRNETSSITEKQFFYLVNLSIGNKLFEEIAPEADYDPQRLSTNQAIKIITRIKDAENMGLTNGEVSV